MLRLTKRLYYAKNVVYNNHNLMKNKELLKQIFTSSSRIDIMDLFFTDEKPEIYMTMLKKKYGRNLSSYQKELDNLVCAGFLKERKEGKKRVFTLNPQFLFISELKQIFKKTEEKPISEYLHDFKKIRYAFLYDKYVPTKTAFTKMLLIVTDDDFANHNQIENIIEKHNTHTNNGYQLTIISKSEMSLATKNNNKEILEAINADKKMIYVRK